MHEVLMYGAIVVLVSFYPFFSKKIKEDADEIERDDEINEE